MSSPQPPKKGNRQTPKYNPIETESRESILVSIDAVGDTTIRPARSNVLRQIRPTPLPPSENDETKKKQDEQAQE